MGLGHEPWISVVCKVSIVLVMSAPQSEAVCSNGSVKAEFRVYSKLLSVPRADI